MNTDTGRLMTEAAAAARIDEVARGEAAAMWALGDYHRFATELVWDLGAELVAAAGVDPGDRVLDVAAGSGNVATRAAAAGARVVASDITRESLDAGRAAAEEAGLEIDWVEADAQALPFADGEFDVVLSAVGAMFAPDHGRTAAEMARVCRPGGTIAMINFTPEGLAAEFFGLFGRFSPPPPENFTPPVLWGSEEHVRALFGGLADDLEFKRGELVERLDGDPLAYREYYKRWFGPVIATYAGLAGEPQRMEALDREFLEFVTRANRGEPDGPVECRYEYLVLVARRAG